MQLAELLPREHVLVPLEADSLPAAIGRLVDQLASAAALRDADAVRHGLLEQRIRDLLPAGDRALIVHARSEAVDRLVVALGVLAEPTALSESGIEQRPALLALVLAPPGAATLYLQTVSALADLLRQDRATSRILEAAGPDDILNLRELRALKIQPRLTVRDLMAHRVEHISPDASVRDAIDRMTRYRLRVLPVVGDKREILGIITDRDVMRVLLPQIPRAGAERRPDDASSPRDLKVRDIMSRSVLCITEDTGVDEVANLMVNKDVEQLPVITEGKLSGIVTRGDIIRKLFRH